jgi:hypothetical protein
MILYRIPPSHPIPARLARLKPLRDAISGQTWLAPVGVPFPADQPTEWRQGIDGIEYAVIGDAPPLAAWRKAVPPARTIPCDLGEPHGVIPVAPAAVAGQPTDARVDLLGRRVTGDPATAYGAIAMRLSDRIAAWLAMEDGPDRDAAAVLPSDPDVLGLAVLALQSCHRISEEVIHELALLTTETIPRLVRVANGDDTLGKA